MDHEETIFEKALGITVEQAREEFLRAACLNNPAMLERLRGLLRAHHRAGKFLEHGESPNAVNLHQTELNCGQTMRIDIPLTEKPGDRIGRYKLLQQIGEGGCGVVYMAEQEEPVRRRVALKVIKLGMDTRQVIARFEAERQALALMDHPNIAKVLDAGATEAGRPYFVMDLVQGLPIIQFCDEARLPTRARLDLFLDVCSAIQHAHQKGIIHRDIKPSNILVTLHGDKPVPKVIDFGIAKATQQRLTEKTLFTQFQQFLGTPAYMSPEQATLSGLDIDTRSDIYSLGVLLYELLTSKTPFDAKELLQAGLDEMRRTIREKEPARPSAKVSTLAGDELTTTAQRRGLDAPRLVTQLRGDLDWIVMKCLEKDRARRYETANGLATDIRRHFNNEPVVARPPSNIYRFQKMVRRNKVAFATAGAVTLALLIGLGLSIWQFLREREARQRNQRVAQLLQEVVSDLGPTVGLGRNRQTAQEIVDKLFMRIGDGLADQPEVEAALRQVMAETYDELSLYERLKWIATDNLRFARQRLGEKHPAVADALQSLGSSYIGSMSREAEPYSRQALEMKRRIYGNESREVAQSLNDLVHGLRRQRKLDEAEALAREALRIQRKLLGETNPDVAYSLYNLGLVLTSKAKLEEAETVARRAVEINKKVPGVKLWHIGESHVSLGSILTRQRKLSEAEAEFREALMVYGKIFSEDHPDIADARFHLAQVLIFQKKDDEVGAMFSELIKNNFLALNNVAWVLATDPDARLRDGQRAVNLAEKAVEGTSSTNAMYLDTLAAALAEAGDFAKAVIIQKQAISLLNTDKEKQDYGSRLKLFESNTPYHQSK